MSGPSGRRTSAKAAHHRRSKTHKDSVWMRLNDAKAFPSLFSSASGATTRASSSNPSTASNQRSCDPARGEPFSSVAAGNPSPSPPPAPHPTHTSTEIRSSTSAADGRASASSSTRTVKYLPKEYVSVSVASSASATNRSEGDAAANRRWDMLAKFKTELCRNWKDGTCAHGDQCAFAHGEDELRDKTVITKEEKERRKKMRRQAAVATTSTTKQRPTHTNQDNHLHPTTSTSGSVDGERSVPAGGGVCGLDVVMEEGAGGEVVANVSGGVGVGLGVTAGDSHEHKEQHDDTNDSPTKDGRSSSGSARQCIPGALLDDTPDKSPPQTSGNKGSKVPPADRTDTAALKDNNKKGKGKGDDTRASAGQMYPPALVSVSGANGGSSGSTKGTGVVFPPPGFESADRGESPALALFHGLVRDGLVSVDGQTCCQGSHEQVWWRSSPSANKMVPAPYQHPPPSPIPPPAPPSPSASPPCTPPPRHAPLTPPKHKTTTSTSPIDSSAANDNDEGASPSSWPLMSGGGSSDHMLAPFSALNALGATVVTTVGGGDGDGEDAAVIMTSYTLDNYTPVVRPAVGFAKLLLEDTPHMHEPRTPVQKMLCVLAGGVIPPKKINKRKGKGGKTKTKTTSKRGRGSSGAGRWDVRRVDHSDPQVDWVPLEECVSDGERARAG
ncbi:unnamed protein product [Vitrella brassicaformis CCMP3155]|uniref:C3H1-type domain-containing protein n=1 Tax=Vitrella brassicaformis (strain CCMP3155) TaxID=1169540 RepID=A0A0G4FHV2_VITBC|nr:unnamed protein product [Vitrella brassicaformis CCMP3155]|eukprot:CEM12657.1 unnamed protein product [Vitrella brassicaformis CCMP3155]